MSSLNRGYAFMVINDFLKKFFYVFEIGTFLIETKF